VRPKETSGHETVYASSHHGFSRGFDRRSQRSTSSGETAWLQHL